jgi:CheY-like chemotaxis protein
LPADQSKGASADDAFGSALHGLSILVVDDEYDSREVLRLALSRHAAQVTTADSATRALALLDGWSPDLLISDIGMAGLDGYEFIRRVRARPLLATVPAIALTAYARPEDRERALTAGYQAHIAKPVEPRELTALIASLVATSSQRLATR